MEVGHAAPELGSDLVQKLRLGARLGSGAAGDVFASILDDDEVVATKVVRGPVQSIETRKCTRLAWEREKRTALIMSRHPHPHIAKYKAAFEARDNFDKIRVGDGVVIMERGEPFPLPMGVRGEVLGPIILDDAAQREHAAKHAAHVAVGVASGLAHLHSVAKTIHRDVKPDNLLEVGGRVCLCDFSAARTQLYNMQRATTCKNIGTMGYLAPEMYEKGARYCSKVDIWGLGATTLMYYNDGKPCDYSAFHKVTAALQSCLRTEDRIKEAMGELDAAIRENLRRMLPDEAGVVAALRGFLLLCLHADPADRPSAVSLLRQPEVQILADAVSLTITVPSVDIELLEETVEESLIVAELMQEMIQRFNFSDHDATSLGAGDLDLLRSGFHRALADMDVRSLELTSCWLEFLKDCSEVPLSGQEPISGQTLLHALVQNHRSEALMDLVEEHCEAGYAEFSEDFLNARDHEGSTALALAAGGAMSPAVCLRLLELKSDVNVIDNKGLTPLHHATSKTFNHPGQERHKVIASLIAYGAEVPAELRARTDCIGVIREALQLESKEAQERVCQWSADLENKRVLARQLRGIQISKTVEDLSMVKAEDEEDVVAAMAATLAGVTDQAPSLAAAVPQSPSAAEAMELLAATLIDEQNSTAAPLNSTAAPDIPPPPPDVYRSATQQEDILKEFLLRRSGNHAGTAFRTAASQGTIGFSNTTVAKVTVDQLLHELREALPGADETEIRRRLKERWSRGVGYRDFAAWLKSPSKSTVDARRHLARGIRKSRTRSPSNRTAPSPEHAAGLRGVEAHNARLRGALMKVFQVFDGDCDGILSEEEFMKAQRMFLDSVQCDADGEDFVAPDLVSYEIADLKKDGILEVDEWLEWTMEHMVPFFKSTKVRIAKHLEHTLASLDAS